MHLSPSSIEDLRVPVTRTEVEIQTEREQHRAVLFLAPDSAPQDLFEQDAAFFPAEAQGGVRLFARSAVMIVSEVVDEAAVEPLSFLGIPYDKRSIVVHLRNGSTVTGCVKVVGRTRTLDVLNQPAKSFAVHSEARVHHVAKAFVDHIVEVR